MNSTPGPSGIKWHSADQVVMPSVPTCDHPLYSGLVNGQPVFITRAESHEWAVRDLHDAGAIDVRQFVNEHSIELLTEHDEDFGQLEAWVQVRSGSPTAIDFDRRNAITLKFSNAQHAIDCQSFLVQQGLPEGTRIVAGDESWLVYAIEYDEDESTPDEFDYLESRHYRPFVESLAVKFGCDVDSSLRLDVSVPCLVLGSAVEVHEPNHQGEVVTEKQMALIVAGKPSGPEVQKRILTIDETHRAASQIASQIQRRIYQGEPFNDVIDWAQTSLGRLKDLSEPRNTIAIRSAGELTTGFPELRPGIVEGLIRRGETMNIIAAPKIGKSWLSMGLGLTVATGGKWLNRFWTRKGSVLIVDNELHEETTAHRLPFIANAMGLQPDQYNESVFVANLRGKLIDLNKLALDLATVEPGRFNLIILDAWYRFQPSGSDENSNGDVAALYNLLDSIAGRINCGFVCIHHTSKGNQSAKGITDVGAGAGAQSRAPDAHLALRQHEESGAVVVEAAVRSWKPMEPFCLRWNFPIWMPADDLDPSMLKQERQRREKAADESGLSKSELAAAERRSNLIEAYRQCPDGATVSKLRELSKLNHKTFVSINQGLLEEGFVSERDIIKENGTFKGFILNPFS